MVLLSLWLNIVIVPRFATSNALHSKTSLLQSLQVLSHKPSLALVVAVVAQAAVALVVALAVAIVLVAVVVVTVLVLAQSLALVAEAVVIALATISNLAQAIPVHLVTHALLVLTVLLIHALHVLLTHVQHVLEIHVRPLVHVLLNPKLAVNAEALAATKNASPSSSPFCMESSRFR